jgi:triacylglycerol lipase
MTNRIASSIFLFSVSFASFGALAQTSSPFPPPDEEFGVYVTNSGSGLDTGCTYRGGGPLVIKVKVPKVVNDTQLNANGTLKDAQKLIQNGVLSAQATIRFPVYDIDDKAAVSPPDQPEIDRVSFNGQFKKVLSGFNNTWTDDSIIVPIEELKFGQDNELQIDIDTANAASGDELWCMQVDWVSIEFEVAHPYVLQHGISADASTWDNGAAPGVINALETRGVLFTRFSLGTGASGNGAVATNAAELSTNIKNYLDPLKAKKVHIIAHSKGGLDTQAVQASGPEFEILSLSTLSTPHLGSVTADLSIIAKRSANSKINSGADPNGFASSYVNTWTFGQGPQLPGLADLTTYAATAALSVGLRGNISNTFTMGASADLNGDNALTSNESAGLFPGVAHYAAERAWRVMRDFSSAPILSVTTVPGQFFGTRTVLTYSTIATAGAQPNDIVVTHNSANPSYGTPLGNFLANHSTIKTAARINTILDKTIPLQ